MNTLPLKATMENMTKENCLVKQNYIFVFIVLTMVCVVSLIEKCTGKDFN